MNDKITITQEELTQSSERINGLSDEKIIICEMSAESIKPDVRKNIPWTWYCVLLIPFLNLISVGLGCWQKKYRFRFSVIAACFSLLISLLTYWALWETDSYDANWKNKLAQKARTGVVIIVIEDKGWFRTNTAFGTGVVIAQKGEKSLILTNRHVVSKSNGQLASAIQVLTSSEKTFSGTVVALPLNKDIDMALLCVQDRRCLDVLGEIGNYDELKTGDEVVAIGHPNGLSFTMTDGIVSALRENMLIQSSASINPGNSGGPLLNNHGCVIGINTFFIKDSQGLNFAFRADYIRNRSGWHYYRDINSFLSTITIK